MIASKKALIRDELEQGTGAKIGVAVDDRGLRSGLRIWFDDLDQRHGPVAELRPHGLKGYRVELAFGHFSGPVIEQIRQAKSEEVQLARALVSSVGKNVALEVPGQELSSWQVLDGQFKIVATIRHEGNVADDATISVTCRDVIVPLMAAMAELIGYDVVEPLGAEDDAIVEGGVKLSVVKRRERNPRNRLLCIRIHGERCLACGLDPKLYYGVAGSIIEVHHIVPLSTLMEPRVYDPRTDLVPLCPNCHRAVHTTSPDPLTIDALRAMISEVADG